METTTKTAKVLYTAKTRTTGAREHGVARSSDGQLDVQLAPPGSGRTGTNPEQLFAAGWSACFESAMDIGARQLGVSLPEDTAIDAEVDLRKDKGGAFLQARLHIHLPGLDRGVAQRVVEFARQNCPYSKAIQGNVQVEYNLV